MNAQELFFKLVCSLRSLQIYYQFAHHNVSKAVFFSDHGALGDFYDELQGEYDRAAEKYVAQYEKYNLQQMMVQVSDKLKSYPSEVKENKDFFVAALGCEKEIGSMVDAIVRQGGYSEGCKNLISDIGTKSEERVYKIQQRVK